MAYLIAALFHYGEIRLSPSNYELKIDPVPTPSPDKRMKFEVATWRYPLP